MTNKPKASAATTSTKAEGEQEDRKPLPVPPGGWPADEYTGKAGRFVRDPFTGLRSPAPADPEEQAEQTAGSPQGLAG